MNLIMKKVKNDIPVRILIQNHISHLTVFFLIQMYIPISDSCFPFIVLQIDFINFRQIIRKLIFELSPHRAISDNCKYDKFNVRERLYHTIDPTGYTADHVWITSFCHDTDLHFITSFILATSYKVSSKTFT